VPRRPREPAVGRDRHPRGVKKVILNGLALAETDGASQAPPTALASLSLPPRKMLTVPASAEMVERLHLKDGIRSSPPT
jgi:hypothetical protein